MQPQRQDVAASSRTHTNEVNRERKHFVGGGRSCSENDTSCRHPTCADVDWSAWKDVRASMDTHAPPGRGISLRPTETHEAHTEGHDWQSSLRRTCVRQKLLAHPASSVSARFLKYLCVCEQASRTCAAKVSHYSILSGSSTK